ncbi:MAG TPA: ATP-binding protein [Pyrinomonadaceae bacterium]
MTEEQRLFLTDAEEIVERLYRDLEQLRIVRSDGRRRRELAAQIFRRVHTLKGSAASLTFRSVSEIAHQFEAVLDGTRLGRLELTDDMLDTFEAAVAAIERALQTPPEEKSARDDSVMVQRLAAYAQASNAQGVIASGLRAALPPDIAGSLSEYDLQHAREAIREGAKLFIVSAGFLIDSFDRDFRELTKLLGEGGETIATIPGRPAGDDQINFQILYAAEYISSEVLRRASSLGNITHTEIKIEMPAGETRSSLGTAYPLTRATDRGDYGAVRIELTQLDDLISTASELSRQTANALATISGSTQAEAAESVTRDLRMRFVAFEERLIKLRLVPAGEVLQRAAARAGRIAARHLGKDVEFEIKGADVGIEKSLADVIADPLLHLVRNAITHGIEAPDDRRAAGKDPTGHVTLAAANQSGRIQVTVTDDGRGIELDRVVATAAQQGISSGGLSEDQCLRLIFRPGFSTSRELSEMAGRGIGLDVVDRAMDIAGGEVRVATEKGAGTSFAMIVPAVLSLAKCVIVRCGKQLYAIDAAHVSGSSATGSRSGIDATGSTNVPLVYLTSLITLSNDYAEDVFNEGDAFIVWRRPAHSQNGGNGVPGYRIAVDEIIATQETLIRGLGRHAYRWVGICGAAEMSDGAIALVLDLPELIKRGLETSAG